ncbi:MAG: cation diffusion facilitator family transporter [Gemmatimonadetes bacterium]|nr:cation diffusion facilitator family transporter [Gemmatimonadota bacterium]
MEQEAGALRLSVWMSMIMAALGIGFGLLTESDAIMLDGFFSLIGFVMALVTIRVARLVVQPADQHFHFGYAQFEPFLNAAKGLLMLGVAGFAFAGAVDAVIHGGHDVKPGLATLYAILALTGCLAVGAAQRKAAARTGSPLLAVDSKNWLIDGFLSGVVLLVFVAAVALDGTRWAFVVPYMDPGLVILLVLGIVFIPLRIVRDNMREILAFAPDSAFQEDVRARVEGALEGVPVASNQVRMMKIGRFLYVLNQVVVSPEFRPGRVDDLDQVRARIAAAMEGFEPTPVVDTLFTEDEKWAE